VILLSQPKIRLLKIRNEKKRIFEGWASVEVVDKQGEIVPAKELEKAMIDFMDRGGTIVFEHSNKPVGKVLQWQVDIHPIAKKPGIKFIGKIFDDYEFDDWVWEQMKSGTVKGFSIGAQAETKSEIIKDEKTGTTKPVNLLHGIRLFELSACYEGVNPFATVTALNFFAKSLMEKKDCGVCQLIKKYEKRFTELYKSVAQSEEVAKVTALLDSLLEEENVDKVKMKQIFKSLVTALLLLLEEAQKKKVYVRDVSEVPPGATAYRGERGGIYYRTEEMRERVGEIREPPRAAPAGRRAQEEAVNRLIRQHPFTSLIRCRDGNPAVAAVVDLVSGYVFPVCQKHLDKLLKRIPKEKLRNIIIVPIEEVRRIFGKQKSLNIELPEEIMKAMPDDVWIFKADILKDTLVEVQKPGDVRPPKKWFDECVRRVKERGAVNPEALCGWVYYHQLKPRKPEDTVDEPETVTARERKRRWLARKAAEAKKDSKVKKSNARNKRSSRKNSKGTK